MLLRAEESGNPCCLMGIRGLETPFALFTINLKIMTVDNHIMSLSFMNGM